ncbi:MAG: ArsR/SmtB family transcription factor [Chthoniobacterales bacterium]
MKAYHHPKLKEIDLETVMQALADPCRLSIVRKLLREGGPLACHEFDLELSKGTCSHHFEVLRNAGIIETRGEGTRSLSQIREQDLKKRFPGLLDLVDAG